jgi:hypothetical protein
MIVGLDGVHLMARAEKSRLMFGTADKADTLQSGEGQQSGVGDIFGLSGDSRLIGRWSMIDIFMESLLGALVAFGAVVTIQPGAGALAFCAVVALTMFAAETFDPRLMWDGATRREPTAMPTNARLAVGDSSERGVTGRSEALANPVRGSARLFLPGNAREPGNLTLRHGRPRGYHR